MQHENILIFFNTMAVQVVIMVYVKQKSKMLTF